MSLPPKAPPVYKPIQARLAAPPVFRTNQASTGSAQLKTANHFSLEPRPAPPIYRPQHGLQLKPANPDCRENRSAPPVYHPYALAQQKPPANFRLETRPAPPAYAPQKVHDALVAQRTKMQVVRTSPVNLVTHRQTHSPVPAMAPPRALLQMTANRPTVLQRMEAKEPENPGPEMRSQFNKGENSILCVDLNCGRYCVESAMKWRAQQLRWDLIPDVFHHLPEPTPKSVLGLFKVKASWSPGVEGREFTNAVPKPKTLGEWDEAIKVHGPLTVSGALGDAYVAWVGHYILVTGVDMDREQLICKDPLKADEVVRHDFKWIQDRITTVHAIKLEKLYELKQ